MSVQVKVGGVWLSDIGAWGELEWSHAADGGCKDVSWKMDLPLTYTNSVLGRGALVEIRVGPTNVWQGFLSEPDMDDDWTFTALGLSELGHDYLCFDAAGNTTSTPDVAIDQAIARGLPWKRPTSISNTPFGSGTDQTDSLNYLSDLLDAYARANGMRWGVDANANVYVNPDPTTPTYFMAPGSGRFGLADDDYASDLFGRYLSSSGYATVTVGDANARTNFGRREYAVDLTSQGLLTSSAATASLNGLLARGRARLGYTNGVTVNAYQLTTPGGSPAALPMVEAGDLVRMFGVLDEQGQNVPYVDWVIGETHYEAGADTIGLDPVGLVARDLGDVLSLGGAA